MAEFQTFDLGRAYSQAQNIKESKQIGELRGLQIESAKRALNDPKKLSYNEIYDNTRILHAAATGVAQNPASAGQWEKALKSAGVMPAEFSLSSIPPDQLRTVAEQMAQQTGSVLAALDPSAYGGDKDERRSTLMQVWVERGGDPRDSAGFSKFYDEQKALENKGKDPTPYYTFIGTPEGIVSGDARTGQLSQPVLPTGKPAVRSQDDPALQGQITAAETTGKLTAERAQQIATKVKNTQSSDELIKLAGPLVRAATGSGLGKATDAVVGFFGFSPDSADAVAALQGIAAQLTLMVPRMEGPQGVLDLQLYEKAAGDIGNASTPTSQKLAALRTISQLNAKYRELNPQGSPANAPRTEVRRGKDKSGRTVIQYSDGTLGYAD